MSNIIKSTRVKVVEKYDIDIPDIYNTKPIEIDTEVKHIDNKQKVVLNDEILKSAKKEANTIIEQAQTEANNILTQAVEDADIQSQSILKQAQQDGYNSGYNKAIDEVAPIKAQAQNELQLAQTERQQIIASIEPQMIQLVIKISKSIFGTMIDIKPQTIGLLIKKGLSEVTGTGQIMVHVSKDEYEFAQQQKENLCELLGGNSELEIIKDITLNQGDCIIETPFGNVDCSFDQQFESIKNELMYILENR